MIKRCTNPNCASYRNYGGRGISVCTEWRDFVRFQNWASSQGYEPGLTIDRIENDGNYEPGNCRWATSSQQRRNSRQALHLITAFGETKCLSDWIADTRCPVTESIIHHRLRDGWDGEAAVTVPPFRLGSY
jgi:hypothetical protein